MVNTINCPECKEIVALYNEGKKIRGNCVSCGAKFYIRYLKNGERK